MRPAPTRVWWDCGGRRRVVLDVEPLVLDLRTPFGTSHSTTSQRLNAFVRFTIQGEGACDEEGHPRPDSGSDGVEVGEAHSGGAGEGGESGSPARKVLTVGISEVGLPPKKPGVYEADYRDVRRFVKVFGTALATRLGSRCTSWGCDNDNDDDDDDTQQPPTEEEAIAWRKEKVNVLEGLPQWCLPDVRRASASATRKKRGGEEEDEEEGDKETARRVMVAALEALDVSRHHAWSRSAARAGVEVAVLDAWAKLVGVPLRDFIGFDARHPRRDNYAPPPLVPPPRPPPPPECLPAVYPAPPPPPRSSYYTVAMDDDVKAAVENARWGRQFTPYLKLKVDGNLQRAVGIFRALHDEGLLQLVSTGESKNEGGDWSSSSSSSSLSSQAARRHVCVDANAAWTPQLARDALGPDALGPYLSCVAVLEQPFPVDLPWKRMKRGESEEESSAVCSTCTGYTTGKQSGGKEGKKKKKKEEEAEEEEEDRNDDVEAWADAAAAWREAGVTVIADETVRDAIDVASVSRLSLAHGVNLKMEKAGGVRGMIAAAEEATRGGMLVWLGIMVATGLNCAATAHLLDLTPEDTVGRVLPSRRALFGGGCSSDGTWSESVSSRLRIVDNEQKTVVAFCDLDGNLLVDEASQRRFVGGIRWTRQDDDDGDDDDDETLTTTSSPRRRRRRRCGGVIVLSGGAGHGVTERNGT